jgi:hypothetical protein
MSFIQILGQLLYSITFIQTALRVFTWLLMKREFSERIILPKPSRSSKMICQLPKSWKKSQVKGTRASNKSKPNPKR